MPQEPNQLKVTVFMDADVLDLKDLASDIGELADLVPEWQQMEAEEIMDRIVERIGSWVKARWS